MFPVEKPHWKTFQDSKTLDAFKIWMTLPLSVLKWTFCIRGSFKFPQNLDNCHRDYLVFDLACRTALSYDTNCVAKLLNICYHIIKLWTFGLGSPPPVRLLTFTYRRKRFKINEHSLAKPCRRLFNTNDWVLWSVNPRTCQCGAKQHRSWRFMVVDRRKRRVTGVFEVPTLGRRNGRSEVGEFSQKRPGLVPTDRYDTVVRHSGKWKL